MINKKKINAAIIIIGNEILSGRTQDTNTSTISLWLNSIGVVVKEVRVIPDIEKTIIENGELGGEGFFRMPMGKNWAKMIESEIADFQNIGGPYGGSTTAAEFLYKFVDKKTAWAHLDIAGMCWSKSGNATTPKGAVGFGVKTLFNVVDNTDGFEWFAVEEKMSY